MKWWLYWAGYKALSILLAVLGLPIIASLAYTKSWIQRPSKSSFYPGTVWAWKFEPLTFVWGNEEDGVKGAEWYSRTNGQWSETRRAFVWSAWRNSVNNLRLLPGAMIKLSAMKSRKLLGGTLISDASGRQCLRYSDKIRFGWNIRLSNVAGDYAWPV